MNALFATVKEYDSYGNVILAPQFEIDLSQRHWLILPNHKLELIEENEIEQLESGELFSV